MQLATESRLMQKQKENFYRSRNIVFSSSSLGFMRHNCFCLFVATWLNWVQTGGQAVGTLSNLQSPSGLVPKESRSKLESKKYQSKHLVSSAIMSNVIILLSCAQNSRLDTSDVSTLSFFPHNLHSPLAPILIFWEILEEIFRSN